MHADQSKILTINAGSSSIKFSVYQYNEVLKIILHGKIERIGTPTAGFVYTRHEEVAIHEPVPAKDIAGAALFLIDWLEKEISFKYINAVGHRIVQGMRHTGPVIINQEIIEEFKQISVFDPDHMPGAIVLIEKIREKYPTIKQVACFDTAFHAAIPRVASMFALPRHFEKDGIRRYGFHGISYQYLMEKLLLLGGASLCNGKLILAHLGSGASMAAVKDGKCIDTSMGFTPAGGFMMGTRTGDLDPGIISWLLQKNKLNADQLNSIINHESGLLGVSETTADMGDLLKIEKSDPRAADAIALFCYQVKKTLCAYAGVLGGLDTIVFTGGIGENAFKVRSRICADLDFLGIALNDNYNQHNNQLISSTDSKVAVYVIPTNEELMIAKETIAFLKDAKN